MQWRFWRSTQPLTTLASGRQAKKLAHLSSGWRRWLPQKKRAPLQKALTAKSVLAIHTIESVRFVYGLDWRMIPPTRRIGRALAMGREEGQVWCALSDMEDVVGFAGTPTWLRGPHYSAALHLASSHSQGGLELFAFDLGEQRAAVIALQESRPLPSFDFLGDLAEARGLVDDFLAIQRGQPIRLVGNVHWVDGIESATPEDLLAEPVKTARIKHLNSGKMIRAVLLALALTALLGWAGYEYIAHEREKTVQELRSSPANQQKEYNQSLADQWRGLPPAGQWMVTVWHEQIAKLPLQLGGWRLQRIECNTQQCKAFWRRMYGSYSDFLAHSQDLGALVEEVIDHQNPLAGTITTLHPVTKAADEHYIVLANLPDEKSGQRMVIDRLQEGALLSQHNSSLEPLTLFGGSQDNALLQSQVLSSKWSLEQALWTLPLLNLPENLLVEDIKISLEPDPKPADTGAVRETPSRVPVPLPTFSISGRYFVWRKT